MNQVYINDAKKHVGEEIKIKGWLFNIRSSGKLMFPEIRDGSGIIQGVVFKNDVSEKVWEDFKNLTQESSVVVTGKVREHPKKPNVYELDVNDVEIVQIAEPYPITPKEHGIDFLMTNRHLWLRSRRQFALMRLRSKIIGFVRNFFDSRDFTLVDTPVLTPAACEGTSTLFEVGYFDNNAYLTQSGQLYNEATAAAFGRVYSFGPTFRAEKSKTRRHLTEFWMVEPEVAYMDLDGVMDLAEEFITEIVQNTLAGCRQELEILERDLSKLEAVKSPFPRISYDEAAEMLKKGFEAGEIEKPFEYGNDFGSPDETYIASQFDRPVMVHRYPAKVKAFYMEPDPADPTKALCVDVLAPEGYGEIIGGGQRMTSHETLLEGIHNHDLPEEAFDWYLDLRKYGTFPHSGFGMGIERCVRWISGIEHIREASPFPRMLYHMKP
ncbi:MAG: asparagine--tRNA ligase [Pyrinomonadaceae bacterium]|nr:asparagine--tRNA ligase [Pyrinomonadaceae bacterium]